MRLLRPSFEILYHNPEPFLELIEKAGRVCYKSEDKIAPGSARAFAKKLCQVLKHESVIEHSCLSVRFIVDRGVTHEQVRHRIAAYSQESTRYVDYGKGGCQFVIPPHLPNIPEGLWAPWNCANGVLNDDELFWINAMGDAESVYKEARSRGWAPQQARGFLPTATKTEIVVTTNYREWRHIFKMRTAENAHPQIREVMVPLLGTIAASLPELFADLLPVKPTQSNE